ncbi:DEAD/DEAH box helicase domain protein [Paludibacter propionicigenes WB4]|uniref:DEAD-box ATP-dependent RNA helicase RhpA n=1 Tax=Paludibacter propionicigenes (strain DSM 17365 / JCM 13257 / WB4) TaxID=694427 RepID=E4T097_PALPW|nr:DEAD/DEAH box helicase [Paludibacter propionicigenes]ADQ78483.1 DEAD/DEAH box helicase domain protein [Paludibacter propionicigenes WB4]
MTFDKLDLIEPILNALSHEGYTQPTPIQEISIPIVLKGHDLLGCAQTGTGKTAAFAIPILQLLQLNKGAERAPRKIKALIVTPTRELAIQIGESFAAYGRFMNLRHTVIFGGVPQGAQVGALKMGVDILIATPGRLLDLQTQGYVKLNELSIFVLDEADRMLDMGFIHDVKKLIKIIPAKRQSLFFSATMPESIRVLAGSILTNPEEVAVTPVSTTAETIQQEMYFVDAVNKKDLLIHLLQDKSIKTALVFTRTKHGADKVQRLLTKARIKAEAIHGNKSQNARQNALRNFKDRTTRVLVATDIAARGIDIDDLNLVINYEIPNIPETYVHRIGRTGRAGLDGKAVSFCDAEEHEYLRDIQKLISIQIPVIKDHPFPAENMPVVGKSKSKSKPNQNIRQPNPNKPKITHNRAPISKAATDSAAEPRKVIAPPVKNEAPAKPVVSKKFWGRK